MNIKKTHYTIIAMTCALYAVRIVYRINIFPLLAFRWVVLSMVLQPQALCHTCTHTHTERTDRYTDRQIDRHTRPMSQLICTNILYGKSFRCLLTYIYYTVSLWNASFNCCCCCFLSSKWACVFVFTFALAPWNYTVDSLSFRYFLILFLFPFSLPFLFLFFVFLASSYTYKSK